MAIILVEVINKDVFQSKLFRILKLDYWRDYLVKFTHLNIFNFQT